MKVCVHCFNDLELKQFIISNSHEIGQCDYCCTKINSELLEVSELLDFFSGFLGIFTRNPLGIPLVQLIQKDWNLFSFDLDCIKILSDILLIVSTNINDPQDYVSYSDEIIECVSYWEILKKDLKWNRRFLTNIDRLYELSWDTFFNKTVKLPNTELLYRARLHYSGEQNIFKIEDMGRPENIKATAGRANPQGIPYLYLSNDIKTTLYEIRATYLDEVSVGKFNIKNNNDIILVDFTESARAFANVDEIINYTKSILLKKYISSDLSKPIRRYDSELDYIPTQFICEFIRYINNKDGILFNSSLHNGGKNIVLFEQNKVECISVSLHKVTKVDIESEKLKK